MAAYTPYEMRDVRRASARRSTLADLIGAGAQYDLLFIDPRRQLAALRAFYIDGPGTLDRCLRLHEVMAPAAAIVVKTRLRDHGVVATELMPRCGFARVSSMLPLETPRTADIANAKVLVVGQRGGARPVLPDRDRLLHDAASGFSGLEVAQTLFPQLPRRLHAFAESFTPGWTTLLPGETWIEAPTLQ